MVLTFAYDLYGKKLIERLQRPRGVGAAYYDDAAFSDKKEIGRIITVKNPQGLHFQPAAVIRRLCSSIADKLHVEIAIHLRDGTKWLPNTDTIGKIVMSGVREEDEIMVCASGRASNYLSTLAMLLGLHVRVGMEDTIYRHPHRDDLLKSNRETIESAARIAAELGRTVASAHDYRDIVGIK